MHWKYVESSKFFVSNQYKVYYLYPLSKLESLTATVRLSNTNDLEVIEKKCKHPKLHLSIRAVHNVTPKCFDYDVDIRSLSLEQWLSGNLNAVMENLQKHNN